VCVLLWYLVRRAEISYRLSGYVREPWQSREERQPESKFEVDEKNSKFESFENIAVLMVISMQRSQHEGVQSARLHSNHHLKAVLTIRQKNIRHE
jgi:hypothetical protein